MTKSKILNKFQIQNSKPKTKVFSFVICVLTLLIHLCFDTYHYSAAQDNNLEFTLDVNSETIPLPKIFHPNVDLSGRGFSRQSIWPQELAASEVLDTWQKDIGFGGLFRLQYDLWEIYEFAKNRNLQNKLLTNYENTLQKITDSGGVAIVDIFGTPAGLGRVLDKKSPPFDLKAYKEVVKAAIRHLSCEKKYNIWYEVWSTPDLDNFFLGRKQEYLNLYRAVGEAIKELEKEYKTNIPLGGPGTSWWFQNFDGNTVITPERSLIYELIRFCCHYRLPLDFISWHAYSTDPKVEKSTTAYNKTGIKLARAWLSYFHLSQNIPLIVDEWNYDSGANILPARGERANISASYIFSRIQNMYEAGLDNQVYFALEDFQNNKENVTSNVGIFWFDPEASDYKGSPKVTYNAFRMLNLLGENLFPSAKLSNEFVGAIATKAKESIIILFYNYTDPQAAINFLSRNIGGLKSAERKTVLDLIKSSSLNKILGLETDISRLRTTGKVKNLLERTRNLSIDAKKFSTTPVNLQIKLKNLKSNYSYQRYTLDSGCTLNCKFVPAEGKEINGSELYQETLALEPYSVNLIILKQKPKEEVIAAAPPEAPVQQLKENPETEKK
ncbi:MAG: hypothetical protein PHN59_00870 [Candidatus Omnitrophica bacterium]|nr:hypothetical protein [Candidatus Omnitrophota bacterium]